MRAPLLILLAACERPPVMENNPDALWFRSRKVVSAVTAQQVVKDASAQMRPWAAPMYVMSPTAVGGKHIIGHQKLYLREYEAAPGRFHTVDLRDDRTMACAVLRRTLQSLSTWTQRFGTSWDVQLGHLHGRVPEGAGDVEREVCRDVVTSEAADIERRYDDRPR